MSTVEQRESAFSAGASAALGGPGWLGELRAAALERYQAARLPTGEEEVWRYSRIGDLDLSRFSPAPAGAATGASPDESLPPAARRLLERVGETSGLLLTLDGAPASVRLGEEARAAGVELGPGGEVTGTERRLSAVRECFGGEESSDAFDDLALAFTGEPATLVVPPGLEVPAPIVIVHAVAPGLSGEPTGPAVFPRTAIHLGENASARVVELLVSGEVAALVVPVTEISVSDGARLSYSSVQELGRQSWQIARSFVRAGRDATVRSFAASLGGQYARLRTDSLLDGQGGSAELLAAYLGDGTQAHDFRTLQEHAAPRTTSDLYFKGAVGGRARSVYSGTIRMRRGARGSNAFQTNRNLVLSDGAHADSVPNLDIEENDVRCSHASAVGPIDPEQRFYLESRGVPRRAAERLILLGYFRELLERAEPSVAAHVAESIARRVDELAADDGSGL